MSKKVMLTWRVSPEEQDIISKAWPTSIELVTEPDDEVEAAVGGMSMDLLKELPNLRLVQTLGHGIDPMGESPLREELVKRGVVVARANPAAINIAEFVMMAMVALSRRVILMHNALALHGDWSFDRRRGRMQGSLGGELYGSTLGLVGYGAIGKEIHKRAEAFGMSVGVVTHDGTGVDSRSVDFLGSTEDLPKLFSRSRYVVLCLPLTPATRGLVDERLISEMQDGSYLVNISRGPIVVEEALYQALKTGKLAGAALDVWSVEETRGPREYPIERPIHQYNVIMTPHYCGATKESRERALENAGRNLHRWLAGEELAGIANLERGF
ncbi:MAG: NAD(P)-dependent oxidoreductase [Limnochordia bacterium]|jgi:phosphoglycerate dehydrogenase-like enzyme